VGLGGDQTGRAANKPDANVLAGGDDSVFVDCDVAHGGQEIAARGGVAFAVARPDRHAQYPAYALSTGAGFAIFADAVGRPPETCGEKRCRGGWMQDDATRPERVDVRGLDSPAYGAGVIPRHRHFRQRTRWRSAAEAGFTFEIATALSLIAMTPNRSPTGGALFGLNDRRGSYQNYPGGRSA
jgi:hypothetical protein